MSKGPLTREIADKIFAETIGKADRSGERVPLNAKPIDEMTVDEMRKDRAIMHYTLTNYAARMTLEDRVSATNYFNLLGEKVRERSAAKPRWDPDAFWKP